MYNNLALLSLFLETSKGPTCQVKSRHLQIALSRATRKGHIQAVKLLLDAGADSDSATGMAAEDGDVDLGRVLLDAGGDIDCAIWRAVYADRKDMVLTLTH